MNFGVDEILNYCGKAIDTVVDKTGEVIDYSKARLDRYAINIKIREKYQVLGKLCYDMSEIGGDETGTMKKIIADINTLKAELLTIDENIPKHNPKNKTCRFCDYKNPAASDYYSKCGEKL